MLHSRRWLLSLALVPALTVVQGASANPAEQELKARHQALLAAYNKRDLKTVRTFYAPDYRFQESATRAVPMDKYVSGLGEMFKILPKPGKDSATLTRITINKDSATAVERRLVQDPTGKLSEPTFTAQTWKKVGGVWKLTLEKEAKD